MTSVITSITDRTRLNNGVTMPWLTLGVLRAGNATGNAVRTALSAGYRSIDNASVYGNEAEVGQALRESGIAREELFITTKVWNSEQGYDSTLFAFEQSRRKLGLDYVDLYLIHWAVPGKYLETWRALCKLYKDGLVTAIGVSNFQIHHLEEIMSASDVVPAVNQVEVHPLNSQKELLGFCRQHGIQAEAWRPLMGGRLDNEVLVDIAKAHGKTPAQVALRWNLQNGVVVIPKSVHEERIKENADIFDFNLTEEEMGRIDDLNMNRRFGPNPDKVDF